MITKARTSSNKSLPDSEQITDPARVERLLERLGKRYTPLTVRIPGYEEDYTSCIVDVDRPYVLLDKLVSSTGHRLLLSERALQVTGKLDGIDIRFITTLERVDDQDDVVTYYINLPERLEYRQRRLDYRAHIPAAQKLRVIIDDRDGTVIEGVLHDLSRGGAGMYFPDGEPAVEPGLLHECAIELPGDVWLYCAVELRYSKDIPSRDRQLIGARFTDLGHEQARLVARCISELEREFIRKRTAE
jgi:c-di-GMP-binding flagellar brake protein YcgR